MNCEKRKAGLILLGLVWSVCLPAFSQPSVSGPTCVIPGTIYQYNITGPWDSTSTMQICLTGGTLASATSSCTGNGSPIAIVQVIWNTGSNGSLQLTSSKGNTTLNVNITSPLTPGNISVSTKSQLISYSGLASGINCSASTGGSCSPSYSYQWQQSADILTWTNISGATGQNLSLSSPLTQPTFFRRKVTENSSGSIAYSDVSLVDVQAQVPAAHSFNSSRVMGNALVYNSKSSYSKSL
jgi:hypothetical protein